MKLTKNNSFLNLCYSVTCTVKLQKCCPVDTGYEQLIFHCLFWFYQAPYIIGIANLANQHHYQTGLDCVQESIAILESSVLQESDEIASTSATIDLAEDSETRGKSVGHKSKKMHYAQKFRPEWLTDSVLKPFLIQSPDGSKKAYCRYCQQKLTGSLTVMKNHATSELHKKNVKAALGQLTVREQLETSKGRKKRTVIGWCQLLNYALQHGLQLKIFL